MQVFIASLHLSGSWQNSLGYQAVNPTLRLFVIFVLAATLAYY